MPLAYSPMSSPNDAQQDTPNHMGAKLMAFIAFTSNMLSLTLQEAMMTSAPEFLMAVAMEEASVRFAWKLSLYTISRP